MTAPTVCARHPGTETALTCGRCGVPICPECLVHTPGGIRCPDCAQLRRPPMYELDLRDLALAVGVAAILALPLGFLGSILVPPSRVGGFFLLIVALLAGSGAGAVVAESMLRATGKRGLTMQLIAIGGIAVAAVLRLVFSGTAIEDVLRDTVGLFVVAIAAVAAWGRLR
jgi:hypothetical protein